MSMTLRRAEERGRADHGWLQSRHSFSFASYYDPRHMGHSNLRVLNDDRVAAGAGFPPHPHQDMEILSYVIEGALEHRDSMGNGSVIRPGDVQVMSAGRGVTHSEFNPSLSEPVHFLQIWLLPDRSGVLPRYEQRHFPLEDRVGSWVLLVSPDGADQSLGTHQPARVYGRILRAAEHAELPAGGHARGYLQVVRGALVLGELSLAEGDGVYLDGESQRPMFCQYNAELLYFDLP